MKISACPAFVSRKVIQVSMSWFSRQATWVALVVGVATPLATAQQTPV